MTQLPKRSLPPHAARLFAALFVVLLAAAGMAWTSASSTAAQAKVLPTPGTDEAMGQANSEVAVLAGGCFWGVQGVFQHVKGVSRAVSGYTGGDKASAEYETVSGGRTGHAESV